MRKYGNVLLFIILMPLSLSSQVDPSPPVIDFKTLESMMDKSNDTIYVFNFWATWCIPCIKELPFFNSLYDEMSGKPVEIFLVSLDFKNQIDLKLIPFLKKYHIRAPVMLLHEPEANLWIDKVYPDWSGAIPATLVIKNGKKKFYEKEFDSIEEIREIVESFSNI